METESAFSLIRASIKKMKYETTILLRKAEPEDLKINNTTLRIGQPFWYKSLQTGKFSNQAYMITQDIDVEELAWQLQNGMIWVPVKDIEVNDYLKRDF